MAIHQPAFHSCDSCFGSDPLRCAQFWQDLYSRLKPSLLARVFAYGLSIWCGQEYDVVDDVLQETTFRLLKYVQQTETIGAIESWENFSMTIAHNYLRDLRRRNYKLIRMTTHDDTPERGYIRDEVDPFELALNQITAQEHLLQLVYIIAHFPPLQRQAILIDLAKLTDFDGPETGPLPAAFLAQGIHLHDYLYLLPYSAIERSRHASLLSIAYKRLRQAFQAYQNELAA